MTKEKRFCPICNKTKDLEDGFYKYPKGDGERMNICKVCALRPIVVDKPETAYPFFKELDIPFVKLEWETLKARYTDDKGGVKKNTLIGRYMAKMNLVQYREFHFADSEQLNAQNDEMLAENSDQIAAGTAQFDELNSDALNELSEDQKKLIFDVPIVNKNKLSRQELADLQEKWGAIAADGSTVLYTEQELVRLEKFWNEMMEDFDIRTTSHRDYLKKICKCSLKSEDALDLGDAEAFSKLAKLYDNLMKSANFTPIQNKEAQDGKFDSVGELVALCEKEKGKIPRWSLDIPQDIIDYTIKNLNDYTTTLVKEENNLGDLIEEAVKQLIAAEQEGDDEGIVDELDADDYEGFYAEFEREAAKERREKESAES